MKKLNLLISTLLLFSFHFASAYPQVAAQGTATRIGAVKEIMFIHGMFVTPECWTEWISYFRRQGYQVSAPAWPLHETRQLQANLGKLTLDEVLNSYRKLLQPKKSNPPVLIGHSMGGLIAQILLSEGLASAAVAIDSAPPKGVKVYNPSFIRANWPSISPFANLDEPIHLTKDQFTFAFTNQQKPEVQEEAYKNHYVPESRRIGKAPTTAVARIDVSKSRGPLLLIAGGSDHIIPARLNFENFEIYKNSSNRTEFKVFPGRDHWTISAPDWESVAIFTSRWIQSQQ